MLKIGIIGCGLQAATIAGYLGVYGDDYEVAAVMDINFEFAKARLAEKQVKLNAVCRFYDDLNEFIARETDLNGIIIGTTCNSHTDIACRIEQMKVPVYMEKPVSINLDQLQKLYATFKNSSVPVQVSLPMRLCPLTQEVKKIIDSGKIGTVEQIAGYEDTSGEVYFSTWFRDFEKTGGMFMQKAVHDLDYMFYLAGSNPKEVCAMRAQRVFCGNKPFDLSCDQCDDQEQCPESPYNHFHERGLYSSVADATSYRYGRRICRFAQGIKIDDINECIFELENGAQVAHSQNFLVTNSACRRGARIYGYRGTIEMDFAGKIKVMSHFRNQTEVIEVAPGRLSHYGGDQELVYDFLKTMKTGQRSRTDLIANNGIYSTLACLCARESADSRRFVQVKL